MRMTTLIGAVALGLTLLPIPARAEWYVGSHFGGQFGGASNVSFVEGVDAETEPWNVAVSGGWMKGWLGIDADLGYHPGFFDNSGGFMTDTSLMTLMGNARVGIPMGDRFRPFATAGVGMIRPSLSEPGGLVQVDDMKFGWSAGGGLTGYFSDHVGIEGDVRYFRATDDADATNVFGLQFDGFDFVRAGVGVSFKW